MPRETPSPWDPFLPSPPSGTSLDSLSHIRDGIPKLLPEAEEGNVEYKLKLTHVSPARLARLVTQLKWRLLEGGGQAYYELGVADSGALIGLSRADLEASLETLDRMAGEIGASVIVVKEIEVPPAVFALADEAARYLDPSTGEWTGCMRNRPRACLLAEDDGVTTTETETETELYTTDGTDLDDDVDGAFVSDLNTPIDSSCTSPLPVSDRFAHRLPTHPSRPSSQSSPYISPFDDDLAMFSMEPEPPHLDIVVEDAATPVPPGPFVADLGIASVYKPRPFRRSAPAPAASHDALHGRAGRRAKYKEKEKKVHPWQKQASTKTEQTDAGPDTAAPASGVIPIPNRQDTKATLRRQARERHREEKRKALLAASGLAPLSPSDVGVPVTDVPATWPTVSGATEAGLNAAETVTEGLVNGLESLHVGVQPSPVDAVGSTDSLEATLADAVAPTVAAAVKEGGPRLIVEALVVRKQSLEEAFLNFGGVQMV